jgi:DNA-directed RNA polymerase specialized sigma24 family protein
MTSDGSVTCWIAELELGRSDEAEGELWNRYFSRLVGLARLKLRETPKRVADEEDVACAALTSFFGGMAQKKFPDLRDRNELWPLLAKITARKAVDQQRKLLAQKRGGPAVTSEGLKSLSGSSSEWQQALIDDQLQPEFLVSMTEECDRLMVRLGDDGLRTIARRRLDGFTNAEIALELGVIERTVERRLQLIRAIWLEDNNHGE